MNVFLNVYFAKRYLFKEFIYRFMRDVILEFFYLYVMDVIEGFTIRFFEIDILDVFMKEWRNFIVRNVMFILKLRLVLFVIRGSVENLSRKYLMMMRLRRRM